jgi:hypothetical protein
MSDRDQEQVSTAHEASGASLAERLRNLGYDIEAQQPDDSASGEIVARRDLGDRAILFVADASGRFRIEISWVVGEWPSRTEIAGVAVRAVDRVSRSVNLIGQADEPARLAEVASGLGAIVPWAVEPASDRGSPDEPPSPP